MIACKECNKRFSIKLNFKFGNERLAMQQVQSNPLDGATNLSKGNRPVIMNDTRWPAREGWVKMSRNVNSIEIHFVYNSRLNIFDDFKFVGR